MKRLSWILVSAAMIACGGSSSPESSTTPAAADTTVEPAAAGEPSSDAGPANEEVDYQEVDLPAASDLLPLLRVGAEGIGCTLVAQEADGLAYQCKEGLIFMVQKGAKLRYACENVPADQCGALMTRITEKMLSAAGG